MNDLTLGCRVTIQLSQGSKIRFEVPPLHPESSASPASASPIHSCNPTCYTTPLPPALSRIWSISGDHVKPHPITSFSWLSLESRGLARSQGPGFEPHRPGWGQKLHIKYQESLAFLDAQAPKPQDTGTGSGVPGLPLARHGYVILRVSFLPSRGEVSPPRRPLRLAP